MIRRTGHGRIQPVIWPMSASPTGVSETPIPRLNGRPGRRCTWVLAQSKKLRLKLSLILPNQADNH